MSVLTMTVAVSRNRVAAPGSPGLHLCQGRDAGARNLLVLERLDPRHADGTDAFIVVHDRHRALDEQAGRKGDEGRAFLDPLLEILAGPPRQGGCPRLAGRDLG